MKIQTLEALVAKEKLEAQKKNKLKIIKRFKINERTHENYSY